MMGCIAKKKIAIQKKMVCISFEKCKNRYTSILHANFFQDRQSALAIHQEKTELHISYILYPGDVGN
jgi:hypothetical protein